jgi:adenylate cyclase
MAIWGAPNSTGQDEVLAVRAALEMRTELAKLNELRISRAQPAIKIGVGVHVGRAIAGTIGSTSRMEYTVIGDTVNQASRIEASTKIFGVDILLSQESAVAVGDLFMIELAGQAVVKGKEEPLKMYKVRGVIDNGQEILIQTPYSDFEAEAADKVKVA